EAQKVEALLVRQLFLASRDWSLARRIGSPDPRQLLEWRVVVHGLEQLSALLRETAEQLNREPSRRAEMGGELRQLLDELTSGLRGVMENLMRPSLGQSCEAYAESVHIADRARQIVDRLKGNGRRAGLVQAAAAIERSARCLSGLSEVALDRAVAQGTETILVTTP
ncbi:MAG TPA: hypothetical protein VEY07_06575, partial [Thermoplasmata archaeon]|nr:hypothetical protein [Thermoplasmata archaeon]